MTGNTDFLPRARPSKIVVPAARDCTRATASESRMPKPIAKGHLSLAFKLTAGLLSAGTAAVTIFTFARSYGLVGAPAPAALTVGNIGVNWISLAPAVDTATALGDTARFAATVTDENGTALFGATIRWTSDDSAVAQTIGAGRVVAKRPGTATIMAIAGDKIARAHIVVRQTVAAVHIERDTVLTLAEDQSRRLAVRAMDSRGHPIPARHARWSSTDTSVVTVDSSGVASARVEGQGEIGVEIDGMTARLPVAVVPVPGSIEVTGGGTQHALAGATLAQAVAVRVISTRGRPVAEAAVRFRTGDGRGSAEPALVVTDSRGIARTSWTLGPIPGRQHLVATTERLDSAAIVIAEAEPVAANTRLTTLSDALKGPAGQPLGDTVAIRATDTQGRALPDVPVHWTAEEHASVRGLAERTDSLGEARAIWTLGPSSGTQRLRVRLGAGTSVPLFSVRATATAGAPAAIEVVSGDAQHGRVGKTLEKSVVLRVRDAAGNPVAAAPVSLRPREGAVEDSTPVADSLGRVRVRWRLPGEAGPVRLVAELADGADTLSLTATAVAGAPANVTFDDADGPVTPGKRLPKPVTAHVTDVYGNPIAGAVVVFRAASGTAVPTKVATDSKGVARTRWTLGREDAEFVLRASVSGTDARGAMTVRASGRKERAASETKTTKGSARKARSKS